MSLGENNLPSSWLETSLGDVIDYGTSLKADPDSIANGTWVLELEDIEKDTSKILSRQNFAQRQSKSTKNRFAKGDVLYGKLRPYLNKVVIADQDGVCTTEIVPLKPNEAINGSYLFYWLKHPIFLDYVKAVSYGVNMPRLGTKEGKAAPFILAPYTEQKRITDKLDTVLARVDACRERLNRVPLILKRFKQSVLAAATSGKLTEDWRAGKTFEIQDLLELIRKEKLTASKNPFFRKQPKENKIDEESISRELPLAWAWVTMAALTLKITDGAHNTPKTQPSGWKYITAMDVSDGSISFAREQYISEADHRELFNKTRPEIGDLLITNIGAGSGTCALVDVPFEFSFKNIAILKFSKHLCAKYMYFHQLANKERILNDVAHGGAQPFLSLSKLGDLLVALPPFSEQLEIVRRVEILFGFADRLEDHLTKALNTTERLTPALLAKAFRGELVPQDPNDEPASELIRRILETQKKVNSDQKHSSKRKNAGVE